MSNPERIRVKIALENPQALELASLTPIFHSWIRERTVDGLLLDVADYAHVPNGPGILLIGHEADYALDLAEGTPGLVYDRKRGWGEQSLRERMSTAIRGALAGVAALEVEKKLPAPLRFRLDKIDIAFVDRLNTPNTEETAARLLPEVETQLTSLFGAVTVSHAAGDVRRPLTFRASIASPATATELLARVSPVVA